MTVFRNVVPVCAEELEYVSQYCGYAMDWTVQDSIPGSERDFHFLQIVNTVPGTNVASYSGDTVYVPPEQIYEADNSHLSTAKGKNE